MPRQAWSVRRASAILAGAILTGSAPAQTGPVDLRPRFIAGHELLYRMTTHGTGSTSIPSLEDPLSEPRAAAPAKPAAAGKPAEPDQETTQVVEVRFRVVDAVPDRPATIRMTFDSFKVNTRGPLGETIFDSTAPAGKDGDDPGAAALRQVVGTTLTLRVDSDGNITEVSGGESLLEGWAGDPAATLVSGAGVKQAWGPIFTGRKGSGRASVGEKWTTTDSLELSPIGAFVITTESVLASARAGLANVEFKGRIEPSRESTGTGKGIQIRSASHAGTYQWDTASGSLRSLTMKQSLEAGGSLAGVEVATTQKSQTTIERLERRSTQGPGTPAAQPAGRPPRGR